MQSRMSESPIPPPVLGIRAVGLLAGPSYSDMEFTIETFVTILTCQETNIKSSLPASPHRVFKTLSS